MRYLITGITGTIGRCLTKRLSLGNHEIVGISHSEKNLVEFKTVFPDVEMLLGDISDGCIVSSAMDGVDGVYHLSAQKDISVSELNPRYCCLTNIMGTMHVVDASLMVKPKFAVFISSDKARKINGVYGCSKYLGERLFEEASRSNPHTRYGVCVFGNVLYSTGSVLCKWRSQIVNKEKIQITNPDMTRFFWTDEQAVDFIQDVVERDTGMLVNVPRMKSMRIGDLLDCMMEKYGKTDVEVIGVRKGESIHESLGEGVYSDSVERFSRKEILEMI